MQNGADKTYNKNKLIEKTVREYADTIYRVAYQYLGSFSDAQDVLQDVSLALVTSNPPFDNAEHLRHWIVRVTINKCKNLYKRRKIISVEELSEDVPAPQKSESFLAEELRKLPAKYRTVLYLYYYEEYSIEEISAILGVNKNTVGSQLRRARQRLKKIISEGE